MKRRAGLVGAGLLVAALVAYAASPYVTLWRLSAALNTGNAGFVTAHVDWDSVRQGMAATADAEIRGVTAPSEPAASDGLAPFGASFAHGLAHNLVDNAFRPARVEAALRQAATAGDSSQAQLHWAFFDGFNRFVVTVAMPCEGRMRSMQVHLRLEGDTWRVVRVDAPSDLLASFSARA